jgi:hypothetical protein
MCIQKGEQRNKSYIGFFHLPTIALDTPHESCKRPLRRFPTRVYVRHETNQTGPYLLAIGAHTKVDITKRSTAHSFGDAVFLYIQRNTRLGRQRVRKADGTMVISLQHLYVENLPRWSSASWQSKLCRDRTHGGGGAISERLGRKERRHRHTPSLVSSCQCRIRNVLPSIGDD